MNRLLSPTAGSSAHSLGRARRLGSSQHTGTRPVLTEIVLVSSIRKLQQAMATLEVDTEKTQCCKRLVSNNVCQGQHLSVLQLPTASGLWPEGPNTLETTAPTAACVVYPFTHHTRTLNQASRCTNLRSLRGRPTGVFSVRTMGR